MKGPLSDCAWDSSSDGVLVDEKVNIWQYTGIPNKRESIYVNTNDPKVL